MSEKYLLAIDQGTTSTRVIIATAHGEFLYSEQKETQQIFPEAGWVEQDPEEIWQNTLFCCQQVLAKEKNIAAIGITNQRETTILWDKISGTPIYPAIIWQDRRTADICKRLQDLPISKTIQEKTGLLIDPYFSASKIIWLLENIPSARDKAEQGEILFGTIDTFLLWRLTNGRVHATDATNASRTMLFNIRTQQWDEEILNAFNIPKNILPTVLNSADDFGKTDKQIFGLEIPICAMIGDQQSALVGQACFKKSTGKITYGTGCFMMLNTGEQIINSKNKLLSTVVYRINNKVVYALEGSIFSAGSIIHWMRDTLKIIASASETEKLAESLPNNDGVYLIPAFTGLGAPYWKPDARAAIIGMTSDTGVSQIVRAGLEAVCYQTKDLLECVKGDGFSNLLALRVDGGMAKNNWLLKFLSSLLEIRIERPKLVENTALGAIYLAALQKGIFKSLDEIESCWQEDNTFLPEGDQKFQKYYEGWLSAVAKVLYSSFKSGSQ